MKINIWIAVEHVFELYEFIKHPVAVNLPRDFEYWFHNNNIAYDLVMISIDVDTFSKILDNLN
jgi:hypothetical protein